MSKIIRLFATVILFIGYEPVQQQPATPETTQDVEQSTDTTNEPSQQDLASEATTKRELQRVVEEKEGVVENNVVKALDYLVIGAHGNECWAYSAYGRKVEQAIELRKSGARLTTSPSASS